MDSFYFYFCDFFEFSRGLTANRKMKVIVLLLTVFAVTISNGQESNCSCDHLMSELSFLLREVGTISRKLN